VDSKPSLLREVMEWLAVKQGLNVDDLQGTEAPVRGGNKQCNSAELLKTGFVLQYPDYQAGFAPLFDK